MSQSLVVRSQRFNLAKFTSWELLTDYESLEERSWMVAVVSAFSITKRNIVTRLLLLQSLMTYKVWLYLVKLLTEEGVLDKKNLLKLYQLQIPEVRVQQPIISLKLLAGFVYKKHRLFSDDEIVALAVEASAITDTDIDFILSSPVLAAKIPLQVLLKWRSEECYESRASIRSRSLLIQHVFSLNRKLVSIEILENGLREAAASAPRSGAVQIYFTMLYSFEGTRSRKGRDKARETFVTVIDRMICPTTMRATVAFFEGQNLLGWYLTNPMISQEDRDWVEAEIAPHVKTYGRMYTSFIEDAKKGSPFSIT